MELLELLIMGMADLGHNKHLLVARVALVLLSLKFQTIILQHFLVE